MADGANQVAKLPVLTCQNQEMSENGSVATARTPETRPYFLASGQNRAI